MGRKAKLANIVSELYLSYGGLITPLGDTATENFENMRLGKSGVHKVSGSGFNKEDWPLGKINSLTSENRYTELLEKICEALIENVGIEILSADRTLIIISSTKADITALPSDTFASTREILKNKWNPAHAPLIISNACISGVMAINTAADYINGDKYDTVVTIGIDALSDFIVYGFQSLFALSDQSSKPFDKNRTGISIGEAAGAIVISNKKPENGAFCVNYLGGSSSNDANHISGPSRTGEGLFRSINKTAERSSINIQDIDFISAHGTGTMYNDEMESIAFDRLSLNSVPVNSLKGYFGHTLGAAGIIEVISTMLMIEHGLLLKSPGFEEQGTTKKMNVLSENVEKEVQLALKTASGFGGGNASLILKKSL